MATASSARNTVTSTRGRFSGPRQRDKRSIMSSSKTPRGTSEEVGSAVEAGGLVCYLTKLKYDGTTGGMPGPFQDRISLARLHAPADRDSVDYEAHTITSSRFAR